MEASSTRKARTCAAGAGGPLLRPVNFFSLSFTENVSVSQRARAVGVLKSFHLDGVPANCGDP
jgi:hypothetical protein